MLGVSLSQPKPRHKGSLTPERARQIRPAQPYKLHLLLGAVPPEAQAEAEATLFASHPHLTPKRDGPMVSSLATLNVLIPRAWEWFMARGRVAEATTTGKVKFAPGLDLLLKMEERRLRLADALKVTVRSREAAETPEEATAREQREVADAYAAIDAHVRKGKGKGKGKAR